MDLLPYDVLSFEKLFQFLPIREVVELRIVNRAFYRLVRWHCQQCKHLFRICMSDVMCVFSARFPRLHSLNHITVDDKVDRSRVTKLMKTHSEWSSMTVSTRSHTRRALLHILHHVRAASSFIISCHDPKLFAPTTALRAFVRHNHRTLVSFSLSGKPLSVECFKILNSLHLAHMSLDIDVDCAGFNRIVELLPKTVRFMHLRRQHISGGPPTFLFHLMRRQCLESLHLQNCLLPPTLECRTWSLIRIFCEHTRLRDFSTEILRVDCILALQQTGVRRILATAVGERQIFG